MNKSKPQRSNLQLRVLTALVGLPITIALLFLLPSVWFGTLLALLFAVGVHECGRMNNSSRSKLFGLYAVFILCGPVVFVLQAWASYFVGDFLLPAVFSVALVYSLAALYLVVRYPEGEGLSAPMRRDLTACFLLAATWLALTWLKHLDAEMLIIWLLVVVWVADSGAYFGGRQWGSRKLAPQVSPGKTLEGAFTGVAAAVIAGMAMTMTIPAALGMEFSTLAWAVTTLVVALLSILGDLFVSLLKRLAGTKDAGGLFPGHGGVMDRLDSFLFTAPLVAFALTLTP